MPSAKSEIVLQFSELPQAKPLSDKKVGVALTLNRINVNSALQFGHTWLRNAQ